MEKMNKKGFIEVEMDMETMMCLGMGVLTGFIGLFIVSNQGLGFSDPISKPGLFLKFITFVCCTAAGFFMTKFIASR